MKNIFKLVISVVGCELVGILGVPFTQTAIPVWYATLSKPWFAPPNWVFGPVWTVLYFFMGVSFYLIWKGDWQKKKVRVAGIFFFLQLLANAFWTPLFFGLRSPWLGLVDIAILLGLLLITMRRFYPLSRTAFFLLVPYAVWVGFAAVLNAALVVLN